MSGWVPFDVEDWEETVELLQASGMPWPRSAVYYDLRWHVDQQRTLPGRPELKRRWGWKVEEHVKQLLAHPDLWWDPTKGEPPRSRRALESHCPVRKKVPQVAPGRNQDAPGGSRSREEEPTLSAGNHQVAPGGPSTLQVTSIARSFSHPSPSPVDEEEERARPPEDAVRELIGLQERDEPLQAIREEDRQALRRMLALRWSLEDLRLLWTWSGESPDKHAEACRNSSWRRWRTLLKPPNGPARLEMARAWHAAGRPQARAADPPPRASPPQEDALTRAVNESRARRAAAGLPPLRQEMFHGK